MDKNLSLDCAKIYGMKMSVQNKVFLFTAVLIFADLAAPTDGSSSSSSPRISRSSGSDDTAPPAADSSGGLDCYHETHAQRHKLKCFTDQGIDVNFPVYREGDNSGTSQDDQKQNYVNAIITQNPQKMCSRRQNFKSALECAMNYTVSCMPSDYRGFMPQPHRMAALVDRLCQNTSGIRFNCVARKAEDLFICGFRKGHAAFRGSNQLVTLEDFLCKAFQFNAECQLQELRACGCATVRLYESLSRDFLYPPNCPRPMLKTGPIACNPRNEALFANNGAKMLQADWTTKLALTIGLSFCLTCICKHALT